MHVCTEFEWATYFEEPAKKDMLKIENLRKNEVMYCMDVVDNKGKPINKKIFGPDDGRKHRRIDLLY